MSRTPFVLVLALLGALLAAFGGTASAALPVTGSLTPAGCFGMTAGGGCSALGLGLTLDGPGPVVVSDDGKNLYAGNLGHGSTISLSRSATTGALTPLAGLAPTTSGDDTQGFATNGAGVFGAVADNDAVLGGVEAFTRAASNGTLTAAGAVADNCSVIDGCADDSDNGLADVFGVAVAPDGGHVYAAAAAGGGGNLGALTVFTRGPAQALAEAQCVPAATAADGGPCGAPANSASAVDGATGVVVSSDGRFLYATGFTNGAVVGFNLSGGLISSQADCLWSADATDDCRTTNGIPTPNGLAISPDGKDLYVVSTDGLAALRRDTTTGKLTFTQCFSSTPDSACAQDETLEQNGIAVTASPDGRAVYVGGGTDSGGYVVTYARDPQTGMLTRASCLSTNPDLPACAAAPGLGAVSQIAVSPDSHSVYVAGAGGGSDQNGALLTLHVENGPSCKAASVNVLAGQHVTLPLDCTDPNGVPLVRTLSAPAKGTLGPMDGQSETVGYTAAATASGDDVLTLQAGNGTNASVPVTITVHVTASPACGQPGSILPCPTTTLPTTTTITPPPTTPTTPAAPDRTPPHARIVGLKARMRAKGLKRFHGTAGDDRGVARVEISLVRLGGGARIATATCSVLGARGRFRTTAARRGRCSAVGFLRARGTTRWTFTLPGRLPRGRYVLTVRAIDRAGNVERGFSARKGDRVVFTVT
jgi:WD40 repeat protein